MKKPPAALAGGGLECCLLNPVRQASFSACALEMLIRMEETGTALLRAGEKLALASKLCIVLIEVEQRRAGCVKIEWRSLQLFVLHRY